MKRANKNPQSNAKILLLDIENMPNTAYVWGMWKQNIGKDQYVSSGVIASFAARILGAPKSQTIYEENRNLSDDTEITDKMITLINEADFVIAHNGRKFDLPKIRARAVVNGIEPPAPTKMIDTLDIAKKEFRFDANSLAFLADRLGCTKKRAHTKFPGFTLWLECMKQNDAAWREMRKYNIQDIDTLEEVYLKLRPWATQHPNMSVFQDNTDGPSCPKCGSEKVSPRGFYHTNVAVYQRYRCDCCGGWSRSRYQEKRDDKRGILSNAA